MIKGIYYENPLTKKVVFSKPGTIISPVSTWSDTFPQTTMVESIKIDIYGKFADIIYSNGLTERTYKILSILFVDNP